MRKEKQALGKGLSALIADTVPGNIIQNNDNAKPDMYINIDEISLNPYQPRQKFNPHEIQDLTASIKEHGVLQPILVRKVDGKHQLIAGERRLRATRAAGIKQIPVIVKDLSDKQVFEVAIVENIQRENLTAIEEAVAYKKLISDFSYTQETLAKKLGKSRSYVANTIRLLNLPKDVQEEVMDGKLSAGHARALLGTDNPSELAKRIIKDGLSVREAEKFNAKRHEKTLKKGAEKHFTKDSDLLEVERMLSENLGMDVQINDTPNGGQVIINFTALSQLDAIIARLGSDNLNF